MFVCEGGGSTASLKVPAPPVAERFCARTARREVPGSIVDLAARSFPWFSLKLK